MFAVASGSLTGKYSKDTTAGSDTRGGSGTGLYDHIFGDLAAKEHNWATIDTRPRDRRGDRRDTLPSRPQLGHEPASRDCTDHRARTLSRLHTNLIAAHLDVGKEATERLDAVSAPTSNNYPYGPFGVKQRGRYVDSSDQVIES